MDLISDINIENAGSLSVGPPPAKSRKKHHRPHDDCQNCGAVLVGEHCHACGQHGHVHRSVLHVVEEVIHGITHLDGRAWRSLPMLMFRPGTLTRNYVMGQRARYVPPFAMFLFSIFAMFLVFAFSGGPNLVSKEAGTKTELIQEARELLLDKEGNLAEAQSEIVEAEREFASLKADSDSSPGELGAASGQVGAARGRLSTAQRQVEEAKAALAAAIAKPEVSAGIQPKAPNQRVKASLSIGDEDERKAALSDISKEKAQALENGDSVEANILGVAEGLAKAAPVTGEAKKGIQIGSDTSESFMDVIKDSMRRGDFFINTPFPKLEKKIAEKTKNPDLFFYKLQNTAYKFSFLLVPLSLPFIWIMLFWKRNVTLYDHAVFALYSLSFVSFLFMMISLIAHWVSPGWGFAAAAIILPVHIFYQFKGAYQLKWFSAFWRTSLFCMIFSWVIVATFFVSIIALGVTG